MNWKRLLAYRWRKILDDARIEHSIDTHFNGTPATRWRRLGYILAFTWQDLALTVIDPLTCWHRGHDLVDKSYANAEHGGILIQCRRCHRTLTDEPLY